MQREIDSVISQRILAARLVVEPESEIGERAGLPEAPERRMDGRALENGIIVKVKARSERAAESSQRRGEQPKPRPHDLI